MKIDIVVIRNPDDDTDVHVFIDGEHLQPARVDAGPDVDIVVVDSGKGWGESEWNHEREFDAGIVHPDVAAFVREVYDSADRTYIEDGA